MAQKSFSEYLKSRKFKHMSRKMRRAVRKRINFFYHMMKKNPAIAECVRKYRVDKEYSWRSVSGEVGIRYPQLEIHMWDKDPFSPSGHQPDGMWLCDAAMRYYKESVEDGWN